MILLQEVNSQVKLMSSEFSEYDVIQEKDVTFCLREFKAILGFQDALSLPLHLYLGDERYLFLNLTIDVLNKSNLISPTLTQ